MPGRSRSTAGVAEGDEVPVHYDPLLAKLIASGETREAARRGLLAALRSYPILGIRTNIPLLHGAARASAFVSRRHRHGACSRRERRCHRGHACIELRHQRSLPVAAAARAAASRTRQQRRVARHMPIHGRHSGERPCLIPPRCHRRSFRSATAAYRVSLRRAQLDDGVAVDGAARRGCSSTAAPIMRERDGRRHRHERSRADEHGALTAPMPATVLDDPRQRPGQR